MPKKKNYSNKKKNLLLTILVVLIGSIVTGGTFAFMTLNINVFNGVYSGSATCFNILYNNTAGDNKITGTLYSSYKVMNGVSSRISIGIDPECDVDGTGNIYMHLNNSNGISTLVQGVKEHCEDLRTLETLTNYTTSSDCLNHANTKWVTNGTALKYAVYAEMVNQPVSVGYLSSYNEDIKIYSDFELSKGESNYFIYIWLDGNLIDNSYASKIIDGYFYADATQN